MTKSQLRSGVTESQPIDNGLDFMLTPSTPGRTVPPVVSSPQSPRVRSNSIRVVVSDHAPKAIGPYVHGIEAGGLLFVSGQLPIRPETGEMATGMEDEVRQALLNALAIVADAGRGPTDVVKATLFVTDLAEFPAVNRVYEELFAGWKPARSVVGVQSLPRGARVEIELIVAAPMRKGRLPAGADA